MGDKGFVTSLPVAANFVLNAMLQLHIYWICFCNECLSSIDDEERSELRYVLWIAELRE